MFKFIGQTLTLATILALAGALYLVVGAYNMPFHDQLTCQLGSNDSVSCKTALILEHTNNQKS